MTFSHLPSLRTRSSRAAGECARCGGTEFDTALGRGQVYWWGGAGGAVRLGDPEQGPRLEGPLNCVACSAEHAPVIELPPVESGARRTA